MRRVACRVGSGDLLVGRAGRGIVGCADVGFGVFVGRRVCPGGLVLVSVIARAVR